MRRFVPALVFLALVLAFLWRSTLGGQVLLPGDYLTQMHPWRIDHSVEELRQWDPIQWDAVAQFYPWRVFYARTIKSGTIPLWNPHQFCGTPFAANGQSAVFYPLNLIFVIIPPEFALGWSAAIHLFLAGLFMFLLVRGLGAGKFGAYVGGIVYAFGAFLVTWLELPTLVNSAVWLPLALLLIHNAAHSGRTAPAAGAGIALALSVLAGHLQIALYVLLLAGIWWVWLIICEARLTKGLTRSIGLAVLTFVIAFLIASPQLLPTLELSSLSHRVREVTAQGFSKYQDNAVPARNLITALVPDFYGNPSRGDYWGGVPYAEYAFYLGVFPLFLALLGGIFGLRRSQHAGFFAIAAIISLLSAFGAALNAIGYYVIPGFSALGGPNRIIVLYTVSMAILAGLGADWFAEVFTKNNKTEFGINPAIKYRPALMAIFAVALLYVVAFAVAVGSFQRLGPDDIKDLLSHIRPQLAIFGSLFVGGSVLLLLYSASKISRRGFTVLALVLITVDLFVFGIGFNPTSPRQLFTSDNFSIYQLCDIVGEERIMPINSSWSLYSTPRAILPPNTAMLYGLYDVQGYDSLFTRRYKDFIDGLEQMDSSPIQNGNMVFAKTYNPQVGRLARYIISDNPIDDDRLQEIDFPGVFMYENPDAMPLVSLTEGKAGLKRRGPNEVVVDVSTSRMDRLIVAQRCYPGWKAFIDNKPARVKCSDDGFQSVDVPKGRHTVRLLFAPGSVKAGLWFAVVGLIISVAAFIIPIRKE